MSGALAEACGASRFVFVVGKGGVGKTTTAGAAAVALADGGEAVRLVSTDPAHSLGDLFGTRLDADGSPAPCGDRLVLEAFDATGHAARWKAAARPRLAEIMEAGTYLDDEDVRGVLDLSLPGVDELMGALRLAELAGGGARVVVDTAPTGHTIRLLDAADAIDGWLEPLRAMAAKAAIVATRISGTPLRLSGEALLDELEGQAARYRDAVLGDAGFLVVERADVVVRAETDRLLGALGERRLRVAAVVQVGGGTRRAGLPTLAMPAADPAAPDPCAELRRLADHAVADGQAAPRVAPAAPARGRDAGSEAGPARAYLQALRPRVLLFAGKGGVGKTTCAAAAAVGLAADRPVLLVGTDPAGSLADVLGVPVGAGATPVTDGLRARQIDAAALLAEARGRYREDVRAVFERIGLDEAAAVDRAVIESFWNMAPPGADEVMALVELVDAVEEDATVVVDAAPTGHFLRLLEMPELVGQWTRALLRILARYRGAAPLDDATARVLAFARQLRELKLKLTDPETAGVFLVTLDAPLVRAETDRLRAALAAAGTPLAGCIINRAAHPDGRALAAASRTAARGVAAFAAPDMPRPPSGAAGLAAFLDRWERVA